MNRSTLNLKNVPGIILFVILAYFLTNCSKSKDGIDLQTLQVDLTDTTYHHLLHDGGCISLGYILVGNSDNKYYAANAGCLVCGRQLNFTAIVEPGYLVGSYYWYCNNCKVGWSIEGDYYYMWGHYFELDQMGPKLKVHAVTMSGNILTIHL